MPNEFKQYRRIAIAEMRPFEGTSEDRDFVAQCVSVSAVDEGNGSPKLGDMIARNPVNHNDMWLVSAAYFERNFEPIT